MVKKIKIRKINIKMLKGEEEEKIKKTGKKKVKAGVTELSTTTNTLICA